MMSKSIYLDNNATTLLDPRVAETISASIVQPFGNPSSPHAYGQKAKALLSESRRKIAAYFKARQDQIIFTSGGSEGAQLALLGLLKEDALHVIASSVEHACVFETLERLQERGVRVTYLPVDATGHVRPADLIAAITPKTALITVMAANNETGVLNNLDSLARIAKEHKIPFVVDGVALLGKELCKIPEGVSAVFFSGHKIHAPQGIGFIYLAPRIKLNAQILGGPQEFGMRGGTENLLGIIALAKAVELLSEKEAQAIDHMRHLRDYFEKELLKLPGVAVNGSGLRVSNTSNLAFESIDGENFIIALDQAGIAASLGSACSSGAIEPSRVLRAMGYPLARVKSSLRFSFSRMNTVEQVDEALSIIKKIYSKQKK